MTGRGAAWKVLSVLLIAALCVLAFVVPSAWLIERGQPRWLAAVAGGLTFPLLPVGWHLWAERRRRRDGMKGALTAVDRFVMRVVLVATVAIAPLMIFVRGQTWSAVKHHATWPLQWGGGSEGGAGARDARLLDYVPADAEALVWIRDAGSTPERSAEPQEIVMALRRGGIMFVARGKADELQTLDAADIRRDLQRQDYIGKDWFGLDRQDLSAHVFGNVAVVATEEWSPALRARRDGGPPPAALVDALAHVPTDAPMVVVARPQGPVLGLPIAAISGWVRVDEERVRAYGSVLAGTPEDAETVRAGLLAGIEVTRGKVPDGCRKEADAVLGAIQVSATGREVRATLDIDPTKLGELMMCGMAEAMDDVEFEDAE